jgi:hypothetical protein
MGQRAKRKERRGTEPIWGVSGSDCRAESDGPEAADEGGGGMGGEGREGREVEAIEDGPVDDWLQSGPGSLH